MITEIQYKWAKARVKENQAIVDQYERERRDGVPQDPHDLDCQHLEEARLRYPVGTGFSSLFGASDVVTDHGSHVHRIGDCHTIQVQGKNEFRMVYDEGTWAEVEK